jgi:hypothetical protein
MRCIFRQSLRVKMISLKGIVIGFLSSLILDIIGELILVLVMNGTMSGDAAALVRKTTSFLI